MDNLGWSERRRGRLSHRQRPRVRDSLKNHGKMPATPIIDSGVDVVTAKNLDEYLALFKKMESGGL